MYLRRWTKMLFFDQFEYLKKLKFLNPEDYPKILWLDRPPNINEGYPLKSIVEGEEESKLLRKLFLRYPDLKYVNIQKQNPYHKHLALQFLEKYQKLRQQGYSEQKAFELTELRYQTSMQQKIDQTYIANNLGVNNQARSLMTYYQQKVEYESRLKAQRIERDVEIKELNDNPPFDQFTQNLIENYKKALYKVGFEDSQRKDEIKDFYDRSKNVLHSYYAKIAVNDKLQPLKDGQLINNLRESPKIIKRQVKQIVKQCEKLGVQLTPDNELILPDNLPEGLRRKFQRPEVRAALMYRDLDYEFQHKRHLDNLEGQLQKLKKERSKLSGQEEKQTEEQEAETQEKLDKVLQEADLKYGQTYKLFETQEERLLRLQIKWTYKQIDYFQLKILEQADDEQGQEAKLKLEQRQIDQQKNLNKLIDKLREVKLNLESKSVSKAGELLFQEHKDLLEDRQTLKRLGTTTVEKVLSYFRIPVEQRRLTSAAQQNDDIITNLIKVKSLPTDVSKLGSDGIVNKITEQDLIDDKLLVSKINQQLKLTKYSNLTNFQDNEQELDDEEIEERMEKDMVVIRELSEETRQRLAEEEKQQEIERKNIEANMKTKNSRKKKK
ncbi:hypothetical protein pb186bvf_015070 [Paramecium bursaria]